MRNGFIFNHGKCVNCNACSAACILENEWDVRPRNIYTFNYEAETLMPVINLSLACNHCESAACMNSCPASAYSRDSVTGAVIIDELKCIGCKYCQWNCPYDAPKFNATKKTIGKCHFCYSALSERKPACASACPTGALGFDLINDKISPVAFSWFPDKNLNPAVEFIGSKSVDPLEIIPENITDVPETSKIEARNNISGESSLILFSFLTTISVSVLINSFIRGIFPSGPIFIPLLIITGFVSLLHLGKKFRSWRAVINIRHSPLSREIAIFLTYGVLSIITVITGLPTLLIASSVTGIVLLLLIDNVYIYSDRSKAVILHSGQTFISALTIISFVSGSLMPFVFIAVVRLVLSFNRLLKSRINQYDFGLRFLRIAMLIIPGLSLISQNTHPEILTIIIFLTGELIDRILFYMDFNPVNIKTLITEQFNKELNEKERGK
jgi:Fe-S-cluster-containing dehydrogenase component/DMSO reductase anchor subunit